MARRKKREYCKCTLVSTLFPQEARTNGDANGKPLQDNNANLPQLSHVHNM